jgi:tetratricopeptide (TPR) repeat protein
MNGSCLSIRSSKTDQLFKYPKERDIMATDLVHLPQNQGGIRLSGVARISHAALISLLVWSTGCARFASSNQLSMPNTIANDLANASRGAFQDDVVRDSKSMHHFLVGQISLGEEDFEGALKNFERAEELSGHPSAIIQIKLADLYVRFGDLNKARGAAEKALAGDPSDPYIRMLYAGILEGLGEEDKAEPIYRAIVSEFPAKVDGYLLLAHLYAKQKNFVAAENVLATLVRNQPQEPIGHLYLGRAYESQEKLAKAEKEYEWVVGHDSSLATGFPELVRVLIRQSKLERAKRLCEKMLQKDPNNALARKVLSFIMIDESNLDQALEHLTALEALEADPTETRFKVALIQIEKQNYREAMSELNLILVKDPKHAEARYYLASLYAGSGRRKEAIDELDQIDKESSMYVKAKTFAAFVLRQDKDFDAALEAVDDALSVQPDNSNLILYSVLVLRDMDELRKAEARLREALERMPSDERLQFNLALVLHERGKVDEALAMMEKIIEANPKNSEALNYVAYALAERKTDLARAQELARRALESSANDGYCVDTLGFIYFQQGRYKEAEELLSQAVALTGRDPVIIEHYVRTLLVLEKRKEAVAILKSATDQELTPEEQRDKDKHAAYERLKRILQDLLQQFPELQNVQKASSLSPMPSEPASLLSTLEMVDQVSQLDEAPYDAQD